MGCVQGTLRDDRQRLEIVAHQLEPELPGSRRKRVTEHRVRKSSMSAGRIFAIAIAFGPTLLEEAHDVLGPDGSHLAGDVLQDLFLGLCDRTLTFPDIRGAALPWLRRMVRSRAHEQRRVCVPPDEAAQ
jgi:hypothetical protein